MELPIICFNIAIYHNYDAEVGGPLKGPLKDTFKKGRFCFIETNSPKKLQTVSALSQSSRLVSLQNNTTKSPTTRPYSHHVTTEKGRGVHSFLRSGVAQRSFAHIVSPLGALLLPRCDVGQKQRTIRRRTRYEHRHTGINYVVSRVRRSRLGGAIIYSATVWPLSVFLRLRESLRTRV